MENPEYEQLHHVQSQDTATYGPMGASRTRMVGFLAEPVFMIICFTVSFVAGSTLLMIVPVVFLLFQTPWCPVPEIRGSLSGGRQISWLFFKAVRGGLAVKRPYLNHTGRARQSPNGKTANWPGPRVAMKTGRWLRCASVTSSTSLTSRRANQLATCKRQTGAGCSLLPPVRLGPPCRRPILIATNYLLFRGQDTSGNCRCTISYRFDEKVLFGGHWRRDWQPDALYHSTMGVVYVSMDATFNSNR